MATRDTRNLIIETSSQLFYDKSYNLIGINEIIEKSGIAKATLYNHFKTKEDIFLAYLDKMDHQMMQSLQEHVGKRKNGDDKLISILDFLYLFFKQKNFNGCWCIRSMAEVPKDNERVREKVKESKLRFLNYIKLLIMENKATLSGKVQQSLAHHLYLLYESAVTETHLHNDSWPIDEAISLFKLRLKSLG